MKVCQHVVISGSVQGVWYRASTKKKAQSLGLTGWVRNLPTGEVEAVVCGAEEAVEAICEWFASGPPTADVEDVRRTAHDWEDYTAFEVR